MSAATTEESTPPDIATTTRVSAGGLAKPRELKPGELRTELFGVEQSGAEKTGYEIEAGAELGFMVVVAHFDLVAGDDRSCRWARRIVELSARFVRRLAETGGPGR